MFTFGALCARGAMWLPGASVFESGADRFLQRFVRDHTFLAIAPVVEDTQEERLAPQRVWATQGLWWQGLGRQGLAPQGLAPPLPLAQDGCYSSAGNSTISYFVKFG